MTERDFGASFFDAGTQRPGSYVSYTREEIGPYADALAQLFCRRFRPSTFLDVGCAKGFLVEAMVKRNVDAHGTDISAYAVAQSPVREKLKVAALGKQALPFSEPFDVVSCIGVLDYVEDLGVAVAELKRLTGRYLIVEAGIDKTGSGRIPCSRRNLEDAIIGSWVRDRDSEKAMLTVRQEVQFDRVLSHPRSWLSLSASKLSGVFRALLFATYKRRAVWPAIFIHSPDSHQQHRV